MEANLKFPIADLQDGIYFNMAEAEYHAIPRLSSSGIQNMMVSPATFWAKSWLNPEREDEDDTDARIIGRAYHCARLEPARFMAEYAPELDKDELDSDCLMTHTAIKAALADLGQPQTKAGENVEAAAFRLRDLGYTGQIYHVEDALWRERNAGKTMLKPKVYHEIRRDMTLIQRTPEVVAVLSGGAAEVVILWTDPERGVKMKARLDYLRPIGVTDFKTFDNSAGRHMIEAILGAFRYNRYYVQGAVYWQAFEAIRDQDLQVIRYFDGAHLELIEAIKAHSHPGRVFYVFQEKKGIPNVLVREYMIRDVHTSLKAAATDADQVAASAERFGNFSRLYEKAAREADFARRTFLSMQEIYQPGEPWQPLNVLGAIGDDDFSLNFLDGDF